MHGQYTHKYGQIVEQYSANRLPKIKPDNMDGLYTWHPSRPSLKKSYLISLSEQYSLVLHPRRTVTAPHNYGQCTPQARRMHPTCTASAHHKNDQIVEQYSGNHAERISKIKPDDMNSLYIWHPSRPRHVVVKPNLSTLYL